MSSVLRIAKINFVDGIMTFSKSFGYAVRGVLYIAIMQDEKRYVQVEEIAAQLAVPRHFMGKILKKLVKENVLASAKGPTGGFTVHPDTLQMPLIRLMDITDGLSILGTCVLRLRECNALNPCPMHCQMEAVNLKLRSILSSTTVTDLLNHDKPDFIKSLSTNVETLSGKQKESIY
ncbi:MAG TPA: Rrf2 family transcriptional regulator [Flavisolibacter sp.]|nr:Rrf2 family transcriptional regulator [Flavisolibacter sp.]